MLAKKQNTEAISLRKVYHSLNSSNRLEALYELANQKKSDANRELIHIYNECQWRETKFQVLQVLAVYPETRALEFLIEIASQTEDLPLAEAAIKSLGETQTKLAARFLNKLFLMGPQLTKPAAILALGRVPDGTLLNEFIQLLPKSCKNHEYIMAKNIIVTLGELKAEQALPFLIDVAKNKQQRDLALSAIVSLGKIARNVSVIEPLESLYKSDSFEHQIFTNSKNQIQFRSHWKTEDYIQKMMKTNDFHPSMYLELNQFQAKDIKAVLDLLIDENNVELVFKILPKLFFKDVCFWYKEYVDKFLTSHYSIVLQSIYESELAEVKNLLISDNFIEKSPLYFKTILANHENSEVVLQKIFSNDHQINDNILIETINFLYAECLTLKNEHKKLHNIGKFLELYLENSISKTDRKNIINRLVRLLGDIKYNSTKLNKLFSQYIDDENLKSSIYYYMTKCPSDFFSQICLTELGSENIDQIALSQKKLILKYLQVAHKSFIAEGIIQKFIEKVLNQAELRVSLLKIFQKFPQAKYKEFIKDCLASEDDLIALHAILCVKKLNDETLVENIAVLLKHDSYSISNHALDALLRLPGLRAKRNAIDFFVQNSNDLDIAAKVMRSFVPPENDSDYFSKQVQQIIINQPEHQLIQDLNEFYEKLLKNQSSFSQVTLAFPTESDLIEIENKLAEELPNYKLYDEFAKSALRSAEIPFRFPELFDRFVDKSSIVLGYSKAIDIILEKHLGKNLLFSKFENKIHEFQNAIHGLTLNESFPNAEKVIKLLYLDKYFTVHSFPLHKASLICQGILSGKIINDQFKLLDGLRAWAVIFLIFGRKNSAVVKPLFASFSDDASCVQFCKKLIWLQDVRNPVAHRQTVVEFKSVHEIRSEVFQILKLIETMNLFKN